MNTYIEIMNLSKKFGEITAVDSISLNVNKGEVLGFLGPNGAGKTTTMRMITGYLTANKGSIQICGKDIERESVAAKSHIGYLPEGSPIYNEMNLVQFLKFCGEARNMESKHLKNRIEEIIELLHLENILSQALDTLSKGFKRRVGLAQAIIHDPDILILDEPTDGLDPIQKQEVRELIRNMSENKAIIISTHILEEVDAVCSRAVILANGKIVIDRSKEELREGAKKGNGLEDLFLKLASESRKN